MMAQYPAPMAGWSTIIPTVVDTIIKALASGAKDRLPAAHLGTLGASVVFFGRNPKTGKAFVVQSIEGGGWGGRPTEDGESASVSVCQGDVRNGSIEAIEMKTPVADRASRPAHRQRRRRASSAAASVSTCMCATSSKAAGTCTRRRASRIRPGASGAASRAIPANTC